MTIRIVTDSTCDIPEALLEGLGIRVVPAYVNIGEKSYLDGVEISRPEFYANLPNYAHHPTSAASSPGAFARVYEDLTAEGATEILSIHISTSLSSILNSAQNGADLAQSVPVTTFDSRQLSMGLGFQVLAAARAAQAGQSRSEILSLLQSIVLRTHTYCALNTLDALRRGGRVGWVQMSMSTLLNIKPLVHVYNGEVLPAEKVRTQKRALKKMIELVQNLGTLEQIAFLDTNAPDTLSRLVEMGHHLVPQNKTALQTVACPAIGVHIGPGALGIACVVV